MFYGDEKRSEEKRIAGEGEREYCWREERDREGDEGRTSENEIMTEEKGD